jgi:hypothetical protein
MYRVRLSHTHYTSTPEYPSVGWRVGVDLGPQGTLPVTYI